MPIPIFILFLSASLFAEIPSVEHYAAAHEVIAQCFSRYSEARDNRTLIENHTKGFFKSTQDWHRSVNLALYDQYFDQFTDFQMTQWDVMQSKTGNEICERVKTYSSNCTRFADGIKALVDFILEKPLHKDYARTFKHERREIKKKLRQEATIRSGESNN